MLRVNAYVNFTEDVMHAIERGEKAWSESCNTAIDYANFMRRMPPWYKPLQVRRHLAESERLWKAVCGKRDESFRGMNRLRDMRMEAARLLGYKNYNEEETA